MSKETEKASTTTTTFTPVTQKQRWVKYGANVALAIVVVVLLAGLITYGAQRADRRVDTTAAGIYSLKPQTKNLIKDLKQKVRLVSLYTAKDQADRDNPYAGPVRDLLEEYARNSKNIEFDVIDPVKQPTKTDQLVSEAVQTYGGAVSAYKDFLTDFDKTIYPQLKKLTSDEAATVANISTESLGNDDLSQNLAAVINTVREEMPQALTRLKERTDRGLKPKYPDYKAVVDRIKDSLDSIGQAEAQIVKFANQEKSNTKVPEPIRKYFADSPTRNEAIQKLAEETSKKIAGLGELKVG